MKIVSGELEPSSSRFFESKYRATEDPWSFAANPFELDRYERILANLRGQTYANAFEPGCSVGVLTARLAPLCGRLLATDLSPTAVERARQRCSALPNITLRCEGLQDIEPQDWDLLVFSEIGYYFDPAAWRQVAGRLIVALPAGATVLASHWLGHSVDHRMHGDNVHAILRERPDLHLTQSERHSEFRLDRWIRQ